MLIKSYVNRTCQTPNLFKLLAGKIFPNEMIKNIKNSKNF